MGIGLGTAALGPGRGCPARGGFASAAPSEPPTFGRSWYRDVAGIGDSQRTHQTPDGWKGLWEGSRAGVTGCPEGQRGRWQGRGVAGEKPPPWPSQPCLGSGQQGCQSASNNFSDGNLRIDGRFAGFCSGIFNPSCVWFDLLSLPEMEVLKWSKYLY